jgi:hypothetical protein
MPMFILVHGSQFEALRMTLGQLAAVEWCRLALETPRRLCQLPFARQLLRWSKAWWSKSPTPHRQTESNFTRTTGWVMDKPQYNSYHGANILLNRPTYSKLKQITKTKTATNSYKNASIDFTWCQFDAAYAQIIYQCAMCIMRWALKNRAPTNTQVFNFAKRARWRNGGWKRYEWWTVLVVL